jgi:hypothetical protein
MTSALAAALEQHKGQDHITIALESIEHGIRFRVEVEHGVLQLVGSVIQMMNQNQQAPGGF